MRHQIFRLISRAHEHDKASKIYNFYICIAALLSVVPLMFKQTNSILDMIDLVTVYCLFLDYILRWMVADYSLKKSKGAWAFIIYPFTPYAILDLASLLPSLGLIGNGFRVLRMFRITKLFRYSKNFTHIVNVMKKEKDRLLSVLIIALGYIFISALVMFSCEMDSFDTFYDALYWATTALTTVGYGDVYPVTPIGQLISMISSIFGIAVIALPAGIITGGFLDELSRKRTNGEDGVSP